MKKKSMVGILVALTLTLGMVGCGSKPKQAKKQRVKKL